MHFSKVTLQFLSILRVVESRFRGFRGGLPGSWWGDLSPLAGRDWFQGWCKPSLLGTSRAERSFSSQVEDEDGTSWSFLNSPVQDLQATRWALPFRRGRERAGGHAHHSVVLGHGHEAVQHLPPSPVFVLQDHQPQDTFETETVQLLLNRHNASAPPGVGCVLPGTSSTLKHSPACSWGASTRDVVAWNS